MGSILSALVLVGCGQPATSHAPLVSAPPPPDVGFESQGELLEAIEQGTFAEQTTLDDRIEAAIIPPPGRIEFVRGTQVPADQEAELAQLAGKLAVNDRLEVDLIGCSDPVGSEALNRRISQARADSVAARLRALGLREEQLGEVEGRGESCEVQERIVQVIPRLRQVPPARDDTA